MKSYEYYVQPKSDVTYLTPTLKRDSTGCFETITIVDLDDKDFHGNPEVTLLSEPRTEITRRGTVIEKRAIIINADGKKFCIVQETKVTRK